jgi:hypothetical protein
LIILAAIIALGFYVYDSGTRDTETGSVSDLVGLPITDATIEVVVVDGREALIPQKGTFHTKTNSDGQFQIVVVNGRGKRFRVLARKEGYKSEWVVFDGHPSQESLKFALHNEAPSEVRQYKVHEKVIARDGEWCNAEVVTLGTTNTPTPEGSQDMSGRIEVKWDDWDTSQWLPANQVKPRPAAPSADPIRCPALSKQALVEALMGSVKEKLGR